MSSANPPVYSVGALRINVHGEMLFKVQRFPRTGEKERVREGEGEPDFPSDLRETCCERCLQFDVNCVFKIPTGAL